VQVSREDAVLYMDDRVAKGFNTLIVEMIEHHFATNPPKNFYGNAPFTGAAFTSSLNEAYFQHVDYIVQQASQRGLLLLLAPAYLGFGGGVEGWYSEMGTAGATALTQYGQTIGTRYNGFKNIMWLEGGDYRPPNKALTRAVANGIRATNPGALHTVHVDRGTGGLEYWSGETWLDVNTSYSHLTDSASETAIEYQRSTMPVFMVESIYENVAGTTTANIRAEAYGALLSGAFGQCFGNTPLWHFDSVATSGEPVGWKNQLNSAGSQSMAHLWALFSVLNWQLLAPDLSNQLRTGGAGVASRASDGSFGMVYAPGATTLTIALSRLAGPRVHSRWYNPATGAFTEISTVTATGSANFTTPAGNTDWVLLLESVT
jgi:hypothetical protein